MIRKVLISMDDRLLRKIDSAARRAGLSRSGYLARLASRDVEPERGPGADPRVHAAIARLRKLFAENPIPPGDVTDEIRRMRDER